MAGDLQQGGKRDQERRGKKLAIFAQIKKKKWRTTKENREKEPRRVV